MIPESHAFRFGAGSLALDLIRTLRHRGSADETEEIGDPTAWDAWLDAAGLSDLHDDDPARAESARRLREHLARMIGAVADDGVDAVERRDRDAVNVAAQADVPAPQLRPDGTLVRVSERPGEAVRALLARDALDVVARAGAGRLRRCADPGCRTLFLDASRPGARRWCAMEGCGARAKKAEQRARQRSSRWPEP